MASYSGYRSRPNRTSRSGTVSLSARPSTSRMHCPCRRIMLEWPYQVLVNFCRPVIILSESFRNGIIYYNIMQGSKIFKLKDNDVSKLMPFQLLEFYEKIYSWKEMYNGTLAQLVQHTQLVILRGNRKNLRIQYILGGLRTTNGFYFAVKWKNIYQYDYVDIKYMKENHLEAILMFYQGLSLSQAYCKHLYL